MARATRDIVDALRTTAHRLRLGARYRWTHMGSCNCGHLAQTVTRLSRVDIHRYAIQRDGEWGDQAITYCGTTGYPMDQILGALMDLGFTADDLVRLERLSDTRILRRIPAERRPLRYQERDDVVLYLETWADWLEERRARSEGSCEALADGSTETVRRPLARVG